MTDCGKLIAIYGCMFSGKSTELQRRVRLAQLADQKCVVFKHTIDKRYHESNSVTHDQQHTPAQPVDCLMKIDRAHVGDAKVIAIEEAQFFDDLVEFCDHWVNKEKRTVIVAGLNLRFDGRPFNVMAFAIAMADEAHHLYAVCAYCKCFSATHSVLLEENKNSASVIVIGGLEKYRAACRRCWAEK